MKLAANELAPPGLMSFTSEVPFVVPSVLKISNPTTPSVCQKYVRLPTVASCCGWNSRDGWLLMSLSSVADRSRRLSAGSMPKETAAAEVAQRRRRFGRDFMMIQWPPNEDLWRIGLLSNTG